MVNSTEHVRDERERRCRRRGLASKRLLKRREVPCAPQLPQCRRQIGARDPPARDLFPVVSARHAESHPGDPLKRLVSLPERLVAQTEIRVDRHETFQRPQRRDALAGRFRLAH